jgi:hypothetical protein
MALAFAAHAAAGFVWEPALGTNGVPFDPTIVPGLDATWFYSDFRCDFGSVCFTNYLPMSLQ